MIRRPPRSTLFPYTTLFRSDRGGQPVLDAVVDRNGFLEILDFDHPEHRPEDLLLRDPHRWLHLIEKRRGEEMPPRVLAVGQRLASRQKPRSVLHAHLHVPRYPLHLRLI